MRDRLRFTKSALAALAAPTAGRREVADTEIPQLVLRVTPAGAKTFAVARRIRGLPQRVTIGRFPELTVETARRRAREILQAIGHGTPTATLRAAKRPAPAEPTLQTAFEAYVAFRRRIGKLKDSTVAEYGNALAVVCKDWLDKPLRAITPDLVTAKLAAHPARGRAEGALRVVRAVWNHAADTWPAERDPLPANPVRVLSKLNAWEFTARRRKRSLVRQHQLAAWWAAVHADAPDPATPAGTAADYFAFLLLTGVRGGEADSLTWEQVDLAARSFLLTDTKSRRVVELPLSSHLVARLERRRDALPAPTGRVFAGFDERHWRARIAAAAGLAFSRHDLRRSFLSLGEGLDLSPITLKRLANHTTQETDVTVGYVPPNLARLAAATERISAHVLASVGATPASADGEGAA